MKYFPLFTDGDTDMLLLDKTMQWIDCMDYAMKHNMNVLYTDTTSTSSVEVIMGFQKNGFVYELYEVPQFAPGGIELNPKVYCRFTK